MRSRSAAPHESRPLTVMDRKAWIVIILCVASLGLWQWAYMQYYAPSAEQLAEAKRVAEEKQAAAAVASGVAAISSRATGTP